jgi:hypothetical protein
VPDALNDVHESPQVGHGTKRCRLGADDQDPDFPNFQDWATVRGCRNCLVDTDLPLQILTGPSPGWEEGFARGLLACQPKLAHMSGERRLASPTGTVTRWHMPVKAIPTWRHEYAQLVG